MEFTGVTDRDILVCNEINEGVIPFLNGDAVIQEWSERLLVTLRRLVAQYSRVCQYKVEEVGLVGGLPVFQLFDDIIDDPTEPFPHDGDIHGDIMPDADELANVTGDALDKYLNAEVMMPLGGDFHTGTVKRCKRDADGELIGTRNSNPILDSCSYEVEFTDGATEEPHCQKHVLASWG